MLARLDHAEPARLALGRARALQRGAARAQPLVLALEQRDLAPALLGFVDRRPVRARRAGVEVDEDDQDEQERDPGDAVPADRRRPTGEHARAAAGGLPRCRGEALPPGAPCGGGDTRAAFPRAAARPPPTPALLRR